MEACDSMPLASQTRLWLESREPNERNTVTRDDICPVGISGRMSKQIRLALETNTVKLTIAIAASEWRTRFTKLRLQVPQRSEQYHLAVHHD
mmetsp:Transcript_3327/g.6126  ORF Transcript_3327/g.6126 Transcript_3327/m.6126 type:complete len:92 (-) Transcript_3327:37-312(-)